MKRGVCKNIKPPLKTRYKVEGHILKIKNLKHEILNNNEESNSKL
jgi:hypothetical protein